MPFEIDPADVNRYVADAILRSTIGTAIEAAIAEEVKDLQTAYQGPIRAVIRDHVAQEIRAYLAQPAVVQTVRDAVAARIAGEVDAVIDGVVDASILRLRR